MKKFEYKVTKKSNISLINEGYVGEIDYLNSEGNYGWELINIIPSYFFGGEGIFYWKREIILTAP